MSFPAGPDPVAGAGVWQRLTSRLLRRAARRSRKITERLRAQSMHSVLKEHGVRHATGISTWTTPDELAALYELASSRRIGANVLEVGSYLGASSCYLAAGIKSRSGRLFCVDTWENQTMPEGERDTFAEFHRNIAPLSDVVTVIRKRSESLQASDLALPIDLAFIDGDHDFQAVANDFATLARWLSPSGVIAFHDVCAVDHPGVSRVVGAAISSGEWIPEGAVGSLVWLRRSFSTDPMEHA